VNTLPSERLSAHQQRILDDACRVMTGDLSSSMTLHQLCGLIGTNRTLLSFLFKRSFGLGVVGWLREHKLNRAKCLLRNSNMSIGEIAYELGFCDSSNFCRVFKRRFDMRPGQFRCLNDFLDG
jgi:AraC-like DNA-binding protein